MWTGLTTEIYRAYLSTCSVRNPAVSRVSCMDNWKCCYPMFIWNQTANCSWRKNPLFEALWCEMRGTDHGVLTWFPSSMFQIHPVYPPLPSSLCLNPFIIIKRNGMKCYSLFLVRQVTAVRCLAPCRHFLATFSLQNQESMRILCGLFTSVLLRSSRYDITGASPKIS